MGELQESSTPQPRQLIPYDKRHVALTTFAFILKASAGSFLFNLLQS